RACDNGSYDNSRARAVFRRARPNSMPCVCVLLRASWQWYNRCEYDPGAAMSTPYVEMDQTVSQLRSALGDVYAVESSTVARTKPEAVIFRGKLLTDSDSAFDKIRPRFESLGFTPQLERMDGRDVVTAMPGIVRAHESNPLINLVLFVLTVASTFITGGFYGAEAGFNVLNGVLFTVSLLTI